jgi:tetratricopeptide (TPR) repeat protein
MQYRTDSNGIVEIPCWHGDCAGQAFDIRASGYRSARVTVPADCSENVPVLLENAGRAPQLGGNTIGIVELSQQRQARLASLRRAIAGAFVIRDYSGAERMLLEALQLNPSAAWIANGLGIVALGRGNYDEAALWFDKAAESAPFDPDIMGNCGIIRWLQNRPEESHVLLAKAATLGYKSGLGRYVHGILDLKNGQFADACDNLQHISADQYPHRDLYMSIAWRGLGKAKAADKSFCNYLRRNPVALLTCDLARDGFGPGK